MVGYEGAYEVSDFGRIRSISRQVVAGPARTRVARARVRKFHQDKAGYPSVCLKLDGVGTTRRVHKWVAEAFLGPAPDGMEVCHNNGDKWDCRVENLRYDTHAANQMDTVRYGGHHYAKRTHCNKGHEFTPENIIWRGGGGRRCRTCEVVRSHRRWLARKAAA